MLAWTPPSRAHFSGNEQVCGGYSLPGGLARGASPNRAGRVCGPREGGEDPAPFLSASAVALDSPGTARCGPVRGVSDPRGARVMGLDACTRRLCGRGDRLPGSGRRRRGRAYPAARATAAAAATAAVAAVAAVAAAADAPAPAAAAASAASGAAADPAAASARPSAGPAAASARSSAGPAAAAAGASTGSRSARATSPDPTPASAAFGAAGFRRDLAAAGRRREPRLAAGSDLLGGAWTGRLWAVRAVLAERRASRPARRARHPHDRAPARKGHDHRLPPGALLARQLQRRPGLPDV